VPHLLATATVEPDILTGKGPVQGFLVHVAQHQDVAGVAVLNYGWNKSLFIEFDFYLPHPLSPSLLLEERGKNGEEGLRPSQTPPDLCFRWSLSQQVYNNVSIIPLLLS